MQYHGHSHMSRPSSLTFRVITADGEKRFRSEDHARAYAREVNAIEVRQSGGTSDGALVCGWRD